MSPMNRRQFLLHSTTLAIVGASALDCTAADLTSKAANPANDRKVPDGYVTIARQHAIPPVILFSVALQESEMMFGTKQILPWPWTLNVKGTPYRYQTRIAADAALKSFLDAKTTLVDVGLMQVCWHYFADRLRSPAIALEPYWNLRVGASILRDHFVDTGNWFVAIGRYHSPGDPNRANKYANGVMARVARTLNA
jgi:Transglycosylase SLT domain